MTAVGAPFLHPDALAGVGVTPADLRMVATGERPGTAQRLKEIRESAPTALVVIHYLDDDDPYDVALLTRAVASGDVAVASDAIGFVAPDGALIDRGHTLPRGAMTHPRSVGTFSRFLRVMVRDTGLLSLPAALRRCSLLPASILAASSDMRRKGRLRPGHDADLIAFDPDVVSDRATYQRPARASVGMRHVIVGGVPVVRDGDDVPEALPGRPVRGDR